MADYASTSPWYMTSQNNLYLDNLNIRPVPAEDDDQIYIIETQYNYRPDLLSYDLYGTTKLWWVFIQRNMNILQDPIYDFVAGVPIYLPKPNNVTKYIGG